MVCAEAITPGDPSQGGHCFYRGCNHPYHQECLKAVRLNGIEGCPRCAEIEAEAEEEERELEERAVEERGVISTMVEEDSDECSMGEDSDNEAPVHVDEAETLPATIFGSPKAGGEEEESAALGGPKASFGGPKQDDAEPKSDDDEAPLLQPSEEFQDAPPQTPEQPAQQPPAPQQPKQRKPKAPGAPKGKQRPRSQWAASSLKAPSSPRAASSPKAASAPETVAPGASASSEALVRADPPVTDLVDANLLAQCWLCLTSFKTESENVKEEDAKHKCKVCCKVDTASSSVLI